MRDRRSSVEHIDTGIPRLSYIAVCGEDECCVGRSEENRHNIEDGAGRMTGTRGTRGSFTSLFTQQVVKEEFLLCI